MNLKTKGILFAAMLCLSPITIQLHAQENAGILTSIPQDKIAQALKLALNKGITDKVAGLTQKDGFYKNEMVKILLPQQVRKVDETLRKLGMSQLADQGLILLNRAAETAVKESTPIFIEAVKNISFKDATSILLQSPNGATTYLKNATSGALYEKLTPIINESLSKVGADKVWENIFNTYNNLPLVTPVNTDLTDYVTTETMQGVFTMIAVEEESIRENLPGARSNSLLQEVFSIQDKTTNNENTTSLDQNTEVKNNKSKLLRNLFNKK